eukprot:NODE_9_length_64580_cov_1.431941.p16 type:complete len:410 gc:universal NODE_9_length_64580_cov_1.431941:44962-43733(-)
MKILYCFTENEIENNLVFLKDDRYIALDVEGTQNGLIELMQLGNASHALLIPIWKFDGIPHCLYTVLTSSETTKLVWGDNDRLEFEKIRVHLQNVVNVQDLSAAHGFSKKLEVASNDILKDGLAKYRKKSGFNHQKFKSWTTDALSSFACRYAASDVFSVFYIFLTLSTPQIKPPKWHSDELFSRLLHKKRNEISTLSLFKNLKHFIQGERNDISRLIFFVRAVISLSICREPPLILKRNSEYNFSEISTISECIEFLRQTKITVSKSTDITKLLILGYDKVPVQILKASENNIIREVALVEYPINIKSKWQMEIGKFSVPPKLVKFSFEQQEVVEAKDFDMTLSEDSSVDEPNEKSKPAKVEVWNKAVQIKNDPEESTNFTTTNNKIIGNNGRRKYREERKKLNSIEQ